MRLNDFVSLICKFMKDVPVFTEIIVTCNDNQISARLLKEAAPVVTRSLTYIINIFISTAIQNSWKIAKVTPIFKEDAKTDPNNYI